MSAKNVEDAYALSPMQEGMLFHSLYAPGSGVYVTQITCSLRGLNREAFIESWRRIIDRHAILRSAFAWKNLKRPLQVVGRRVELPLREEDWSELSRADQERRFQEHLRNEKRTGFAFSKAPLMRLALFRIGEAEYRLAWSHHHLLLDGWSVYLVLKELFQFYEALCLGKAVELPPPMPYKSFIAWLRTQDVKEADAFWRRTLKRFRSPTPLGLEAPSEPPEGKPEQDEVRRKLPEGTTAALQLLAREHRLTMNTVVQGAWAFVLSQYSGEEDVLYGIVVAGRPHNLEGAESIVGLFINTLPVRTRIDDTANVIDWLKEMQQREADLRQYEYSPLVEIQGSSEIPRGTPLFESIFAFENYLVDASLKEGAASVEVWDYAVVEQNNFPLAVVTGLGNGLSIKATYDCSRFERSAVERMVAHLERVLTSMASLRSGACLSDIEMLLDEEVALLAAPRLQLLNADFNF